LPLSAPAGGGFCGQGNFRFRTIWHPLRIDLRGARLASRRIPLPQECLDPAQLGLAVTAVKMTVQDRKRESASALDTEFETWLLQNTIHSPVEDESLRGAIEDAHSTYNRDPSGAAGKADVRNVLRTIVADSKNPLNVKQLVSKAREILRHRKTRMFSKTLVEDVAAER
jgi:hypothetical protein